MTKPFCHLVDNDQENYSSDKIFSSTIRITACNLLKVRSDNVLTFNFGINL